MDEEKQKTHICLPKLAGEMLCWSQHNNTVKLFSLLIKLTYSSHFWGIFYFHSDWVSTLLLLLRESQTVWKSSCLSSSFDREESQFLIQFYPLLLSPSPTHSTGRQLNAGKANMLIANSIQIEFNYPRVERENLKFNRILDNLQGCRMLGAELATAGICAASSQVLSWIFNHEIPLFFDTMALSPSWRRQHFLLQNFKTYQSETFSLQKMKHFSFRNKI